LLRAVWGTGPADIFAVGDDGAILRYDGVRWYTMASPTDRMLRTVWGIGPTEVYAAGEDGVLLRFDGSQWSLTTSPTDRMLVQLWALPGSTDLFAVGLVTTVVRGNR
jgi:hypothetical protein